MEIGVTVGESIERCASIGSAFDFVEFGLAEAADIPESIDVDRLRQELAAIDAAFDVHLPFKQVVATPVPEINRAIIEHQRRLLAWAGEIDAGKAVLHGTVRNPHDVDQRDIVGSQIAEIIDIGERNGIEVVVENVGHQSTGLQLSVLGDIAIETGASVCFDIGHAYMEDGNDGIARFLKGYGDLISHLHIHDARSRGDTHMPIGAGEIDFALLSNHLQSFDGTIAIEVFTDDRQMLHDTATRIAVQFGVDREFGLD